MFESTLQAEQDLPQNASQLDFSPQQSPANLGEPALKPDITSQAEAELPNIIEQLQDTRDFVEASQILKQYLKSGGQLDTVSQHFAPSPEEATPQKPFHPETNQAVSKEQDRLNFLDKNRNILTSSTNLEALKNTMREYSSLYGLTTEEVLEELAADLSPNQTQLLKDVGLESAKLDTEQRVSSWEQFNKALSPDEIESLQQVVQTHPRVLEALKVPEQIKAELLKSTPKITTETNPSNNKESQSNSIKGSELFLIGLAIMMNPRIFDSTLDKIARETITIPALEKIGVSTEIIDQLREFNRNTAVELLKLSRDKLYKLLKTYDRYQLREFLEDIDKEARILLVSGKDEKHQFSLEERQELFYDGRKLNKRDYEYLGIPSEAK